MSANHDENEEQGAIRCYSTYNSGGTLEFDPLKDLNLPASYNEVLDRFRKLQGERALEMLN